MEFFSKPWIPPLLVGRIKSFIYKNGRIVTYKKGAIVVREDAYLEDIFIVKSGVLSTSIVRYDLNKSFTMCGIRFAGHISGCATFMLREHAPFRITALSKATICSVSFLQMDQYLDSNLDLKAEFHRHCSRSLRSNADALLAMVTASPKERFLMLSASVCATLGTIQQDGNEWVEMPFKFSRKTIGALLYVSIMTVDRLYADMIKNGIMRRNENNAYELHVDALRGGLRLVRERYATGVLVA